MRCFATVIKVGEIFAEFGYSIDETFVENAPAVASTASSGGSNQHRYVAKWQLRVLNEAHDVLSEDEVSDSATKVIKVTPSTVYLVQVRVMSAVTMEWSRWSEIVRTRTFSPVKTFLQEIGEDYVRLQWDRPLRDTSLIAPEVNADAVRRVAEISQFCLRVVREIDMYEVFNQEFATGTRTYTLHNLRPGTAHIVYARYRTLIGTLTVWTEVSRFYTQNTFELQLAKRAEDTFTVKWERHVSDSSTIGYVLPESSVHRFELSIVGEGLDVAPLELNSSIREHCFRDLIPGAPYRVRVRCLTKDGRWGVHSKVLKVVLAHRPVLHPIATGETFMSFTWQRAVEEAQETDIEWHIRSASSEFEANKAVFIRKGAHNKKFTIESLVSNTLYFVRIRTQLMGEWGLWSEPQRFMTAKSMSIQLLERGENFFTVTWPIQSTSKDLENDCRFELVLVRVEEETGDREVIMQEEVVKDTDEGYRLQNLLPNTTYELKGRAWQRNRVEGTCLWGQYSNTLRVRTLQNVALRITSIGEDFAELSWSRALALRSGNANEELWKDLKYEVIIGCVDTGEDGIIHKEVVDTTCTIDNLLPSTTYTVSVRACDDREQWGAWSHARFHTLAAVQTSIHEIGETFVRVMWRRENDTSLQELLDHEEQHDITDQPPVLQGDPVAKEFTLYIFSNDYDNDAYASKVTGYPRGGNSEVSLVTSIQSHHTSFRVCDLLPDRTYTAVIRAATPTGRWGIWSQEVRFHTTAPFRIPVNTLHVGENYIHLTWNRDERPSLPKDVLIDDYAVTNQQIRFRDTATGITKELTIAADQREEKLRGLHPATAYCVQIRACNRSGEWGQWSAPVMILTRATILCKSVEIAENYVIVSWERPKANNPHGYATGKGSISSYELRVTNKDKTHLSTFIVESPFKITNLQPNTFYCVEIKANYNDEEWGMWSTPLWCLTMASIQTEAHDIGEEHCIVRVKRPADERLLRVPEDDGNRPANDTEDRVLAFGKHRSRCQLCVTTAKVAPPPHAPKTGTFLKVDNEADSINLPPECRDDKVVYLAEIPFDGQDILHTVPSLKANTIYTVVARSRLDENGDWGMWSAPSQRFITVAKTEIEFLEIGEAFIKLRWERGQQDLLGVASSSNVARGIGSIAKSKIKLRDSSQHFMYIDIDTDANVWTVNNLKPAETYSISIQIMTPAGDWGVWSADAKVRTVPPMLITAENISESAVWLSWVRESDITTPIAADTCINVDTNARKYELSIRGEGGFNYTRFVEEGNNAFFRGLQPDTIYEAWLRTANGLWSRRLFATLPTIRVTFGNIGEHFATIEWRRNLPSCRTKLTAASDLVAITEADDKIETFCLRVELPGEPSVLYELPHNVGTYRLRDLKPSSEYSIWVSALGFEGVWGVWNTETRVRTLPQLNLAIDDIGEDYVSVSWLRNKWECSHPIKAIESGVDVKTWEVQGSTAAFEVEVHDENGVVVGRMSTSHTTTRCTISKLKLESSYSVYVRAKDTFGEWGMWSVEKKFVTLQPVKVNIVRIGENFVQLEWQRRNRLRPTTHQPSTLRRPSNVAKKQRSGRRNTPPRVRELPDDYKAGDDGDDDDAYARDDFESLEEEEDEEEMYEEDFEEDEEYDEDMEEADAGEDDSMFVDPYPKNTIRGNEDVKQWAIRVYGSSVFGGQPGSETDFREFYPESSTTSTVVGSLFANHTYTIGIRAQNMQGEWGHWSAPITIRTQPLLKGTAVDISETTMRIAWERPAYVPATRGGVAVSSPSGKSSGNAVAETLLAVATLDEGEDDGASNFRFSFPDANEPHNYQVTIAPLEGETPFPADDQHVVNGARVYETSQPVLQLIALAPGTRYRIIIKEQMLPDVPIAAIAGGAAATNANGGAASSFVMSTPSTAAAAPAAGNDPAGDAAGDNSPQIHFGMECEPLIVETILPMEVAPADIGENQCTLTWRRRQRANPSDAAIPAAKSTVRTAFYQLRVARMDADGQRLHEGSMPLRLTKVFRATETSFLLRNLSPNAIYAVCVQSQLENGVWGPWSGEAKFVTQKRLTLSVDGVNQDSLTFSWFRQGPDWMPQRLVSVGGASTGCAITSAPIPTAAPISAAAAAQSDDAAASPLERAMAERDRKAKELAAIPPHLRSVVTGDYEVKHFEIVIEGITCSYSRTLRVDASLRSTFVGGLDPNQVYCAHVRSMTTRGDQWSLRSPHVTVCTLNPLQLQVGHFTESNAMVAWFRPAQSIAPHEKAILKVQAAAKHEAEQRERHARFERQQLIQSKAEINESATEEELAMSALRIEQAIIDAEEADHFLSPQNVHMGLAEVSAYQVRLYGEGGAPIISGTTHLLPQAPPKPSSKAPAAASGGGKSLRRKTRSSSTADGNDAAAATANNDYEEGEAAAPTDLIPGNENALMDVKINPKTTFVKITGLREGTQYAFTIRSRNAFNEWGPWCSMSAMRTLELLQLCQSRFGEHYINLYWHRPSEKTLLDYQTRKNNVAVYSEQFKDMSVEVLEERKKTMNPADYAQLVDTIRDWRAQQRWVSNYEAALAEGEGEVLSAPDMPVVGYHLRILNESGAVTDKHFDGTTRQHTLTGLTHNAMYVVLMCADYGNGEWGSWSQPLKIMTQNTIQLSISYVGENFIDATWKRAPNKKANPVDAATIIMASPTQQGIGRQYEASLRYVDPSNGQERDDRRRIRDAASFRLDNLHPDTHYRIRMREWDPKGEWGMWGSERRCVTLAAMETSIVEIGEDWVDIEWKRMQSLQRVEYDDPLFIQRPVENLRYYLRVEEIPENASSISQDKENSMDDNSVGTSIGEDDVDIGAFLKHQQQRGDGGGGGGGGSDASGGSGSSGGRAAGEIPEPPTEHEPYSPGDTHYCLTKRFGASASAFRIPQLASDRFYRIEVLCETTGGQLGMWSSPKVALTMCRIKVRCDLVDELATRVSWVREGPRRHPVLKDSIASITHHAHCDTRSYQLVAVGLSGPSTTTNSAGAAGSKKGNKDYAIDLTFDPDTHEYKLTDLVLNGVYCVKVRATDAQQRQTLWSDDVNFVTQRRLRVHAYRITETSIHFGWGRDEQIPSDYPSTSTPLYVANEKTNQYHVCVFSTADLSTPLLERMLAGTVTRFVLPNLDPNAACVVRARSSNLLGEWSMWSEDRPIYTMHPITTNVVTVGESYIGINWGRDAPDELSDVVRGEREEKTADERGAAGGGMDALDTLVDAEANGDDATLKALQMKKQFPLMDKPLAGSAPVYVSARTSILKYCVSISRPNDGHNDPVTAIVDGSVNYFKIPKLRHDTVYEIAVRACYTTNQPMLNASATSSPEGAASAEAEDEDWGIWSDKVKSGTTNLLQINVKQLGENYFHSEWRRMPNTFSEYGVSLGKPEDTLCYQFRIHDFTDVTIGDEANANLDALLVQDQLLLTKSNVFNNLKSNRRYRLVVRRWYKPANLMAGGGGGATAGANADGQQSLPAGPDSSNGEDIRKYLDAVGALEGCWCEPITVATHKSMAVLVSDISESGMVIRWERDPEATSQATRHCVKVPFTVNSYHIHIDELNKDGTPIMIDSNSPNINTGATIVSPALGSLAAAASAANNGANNGLGGAPPAASPSNAGILRFNQEFQADEVSFRARDLKPDTVYRIEVRCSTDKVWGQWSRHVLAITLPRLQVTMNSIGEDYAALSWERRIRYLTAPDGTAAVTGNVTNVEMYELEMEGLDHHFALKKKFKSSRTSYRVKHLEPSRVYSIIMRSCEFTPGTTNEEWSVWSDRVAFATLKPLQLRFGKIAEQFVHVSWGRDPQTSEEYAQYDKHVILGPTDALSYHFCAFKMDQMPAAAIIDKQFSGDVTHYRVETLAPNTSYIMIVRACNSEQQWGLWGEERVVTTQRVLTTDIVSIGENYVAVKWSRLAPDDEKHRMMSDPKTSAIVAQRQQPTSFHLCITSESETIDRRFTSEECTYSADEERVAMYTVRGLRSDTKYILSLQACYGDSEWGTWSTPITFLSMSNLSIKVANITETSAEFTWGRAQQNPLYATDPNVLVWRGTVVRYQLLLRKVDEMKAQEMRERERAIAAANGIEGAEDADLEGTQQHITDGKGGDVVVDVPTMTDADGNTTSMTAAGGSGITTPRKGGSSNVRVPHFFFEQEMDVKLVKYVQTLSRIDRLEVNTEYHFQVRALDDHNEWGFWSEVFFDTPPNPPQNVMMRKDGAMILLSWDPPSRAHNYMYCIEQCVTRDPSVKDGGAGGGGDRRGGAYGASSSALTSPRGTKKDGTAMDWRVVDTVEDTMCRVRAFGPIQRVKCRIKCCKVNTPTYLFSKYSAVVSVNSNLGIEPVTDVRLTSLSKSSAVIEWARVEVPIPPPISPAATGNGKDLLTPAPPPPKVAYRIMLAINNQPLINVATLKNNIFELTDLSPSTTYVVQVITETEQGSCQRNPTLKFVTKPETDRGVYKWAPGQPPLCEVIPPPQDRTLLMLSSNNANNGGAGGAGLPALERTPAGSMAPRPPQGGKRSTPPPTAPAYGASTPRGNAAVGSALLGGGTPATQGRRPPGTAPHGATRSNSNKGQRKPAPPSSAGANSNRHNASSGSSAALGGGGGGGAGGERVVLPPVSQQRPAASSSKAVEHFDYVGFVPSDDEK